MHLLALCFYWGFFLFLFLNASDNSELKQSPLVKTPLEMRNERKRGLLKQHNAPDCLGRPRIKMRSFRNFPLKCFQFLNCLLFGKWIASWLKKKKRRQLVKVGGWVEGSAWAFSTMKLKLWGSLVLQGVIDQVVSYKRSLLMAPSSFTAVGKILGYEIASLNPSAQQWPTGTVCQTTRTAKTFHLMVHYCRKILKRGPIEWFSDFFFFCLLSKQLNEKFKLFIRCFGLGVFVLFLFLSSRAFEICIFENG